MIKIFKNKLTRIILGILWGLGLSCMFRSACNGRNCIIYKSPVPAEIKSNIYNYNNKCYKYDTEETKCTKDAIE